MISTINTLQNDVYLGEPFINLDSNNVLLDAPGAEYQLPYMQTKDTLVDIDRYKRFISSAISKFRHSRGYKNYKSYLMSLGLNKCQIMGNIDEKMATIEMHHNIITIYDIAILITEHILNTIGYITTFDLVSLIYQEHTLNNIPIVMLSSTVHEIYHNDPDFYVPMSMTIGKWWELLYKYRYGITLDISYKIIKFINKCQENNEIKNLEIFQLRDTISDWGKYNEYSNNIISNNHIMFNSNGFIDMEIDNNDTRYTLPQDFV